MDVKNRVTQLWQSMRKNEFPKTPTSYSPTVALIG